MQEFPAVTQAKVVTKLLPMETIHDRIRKRRRELNMSLEQVAKAAGVAAWQTVQQWEMADGTAPSRRNMRKVAKALKTTEQYLLYGQDTVQPAPRHTATRSGNIEIHVQQFDVVGSMGTGIPMPEPDATGHKSH